MKTIRTKYNQYRVTIISIERIEGRSHGYRRIRWAIDQDTVAEANTTWHADGIETVEPGSVVNLIRNGRGSIMVIEPVAVPKVSRQGEVTLDGTLIGVVVRWPEGDRHWNAYPEGTITPEGYLSTGGCESDNMVTRADAVDWLVRKATS